MKVINLPKESVEMHAIVEREVVDLGYGQMTVNIVLKNGAPVLNTLSIVKSKRKKYTFDKNVD